MRLRIDAAGHAYWNDSATPLSALQAMMAAEGQRDPGDPPRLEIDAHGEGGDQIAARVKAAAHSADIRRIGFVRK
ncbi:MAG: ExbD/TolR family protein [Luteimonas sp.]